MHLIHSVFYYFIKKKLESFFFWIPASATETAPDNTSVHKTVFARGKTFFEAVILL